MTEKPLISAGTKVFLPKQHRTLGGWFGEATLMEDVHDHDDVAWLCADEKDAENQWKWKLVLANQVKVRRARKQH